MAPRSSLASEQGSLMIEVIMGALILAFATFAVFNGLEGAQATGRMNKERSVSSTLAQQDIERLRAFPITALSNYHQARTVNVAGVGYAVDSRSDWVVDSTGVVSCTTDAAPPQYMKLTSTVRSPASVNPVKEVSLLTPAPGAFSGTDGTVAVKVTRRDGTPHVGVGVQLSGPGSFSSTTNEFGCAIFGMIPSGNYDVDVPGYVGWGGQGFADGQLAVVAAKTSLKQMEVELPASLSAKFKVPPGVPADWGSAALSNAITVANAKLPGGLKEFPSASAVGSIDATGLFPFLDGYGVYAGTCRANNPAFWQSTYFQPGGPGQAALDPGDFLKPVDVHMGALRVTVRTATNTVFGATWPARVTVRLGDTGDARAGCAANTLVYNITATDHVDFILPMGTYRVCVSGSNTQGGTVRNKQTATSASSGIPAHPRLAPTTGLYQPLTMSLPSSGSTGACSVTPT